MDLSVYVTYAYTLIGIICIDTVRKFANMICGELLKDGSDFLLFTLFAIMLVEKFNSSMQQYALVLQRFPGFLRCGKNIFMSAVYCVL